MKQAILITAYNQSDTIIKTINHFDQENFVFFIHWDKKYNIPDKLLAIKNERSNVFLYRKYKVNYGAINHLKAYLYLCKKSLELNDIEFIHLITESDLPIKSNQEFFSFFSNNKETLFLENFKLPNKGWGDKNGGLDRICYYVPYNHINYLNKRHQIIIKIFQNIENIFHYYRPEKFKSNSFYAGSTYWSLPRNAVKYVLYEYKNYNTLLKRFKGTYCAEECFFQTVLLNSYFSSKIQNDNLRYIDWSGKNGKYPSFLDDNDYVSILSSNAFFARKITSKHSLKLISMLNANVN